MVRRVVAILGTRYRDFSIEEAVLGPLGVELVSGDGGSPEAILAVAARAEVVLAGSAPRFTADVIADLSARGIVRYGIGTETINIDAARDAGIAVARVSDYGTEAVAFHTVAMALAQVRRLPEADRIVRSGGWGVGGLRPLHLPSTLTAGVIGYGRIGRQVGRHFKGLGFSVCAFDEYATVPAEDAVDAVTLQELLERSDVVSVHAPGDADGTPLLGAGDFARMREGSVLVNTARGSLLDAAALVEALLRGRPARAALDVYSQEPPDTQTYARVADRIMFSPHMAWYTDESETDMRRKAAEEAARLLQGEPLRDPVVDTGVKTA